MSVQITTTFYPKTRDEWRKWLKKNHTTKKEIWVVYYKKHTRKPTVAYQDAVEEALCFGWIDGLDKSIDEEKYAQRFTPRKEKSNWTTTNMERYKKLLKQGLVSEAGKKAFEDRMTDTN